MAIVALNAHRERQEAAGLRPLPTALVFPSTAGTALELRHVRLHDLRHSFGVLLLGFGLTGLPSRTALSAFVGSIKVT